MKKLFEKKVNINNSILISQNKNIRFKLISEEAEQSVILGNANIYIPAFMKLLWKNPKSLATILLKADKYDIKKNLSHFVMHNLYNNTSSLNNKEEQIIYIITILLKDEIKSLKNIDSPFLNETTCGIILQKLSEKKEVIFFFKSIINEILKLLDNNYYTSKNICLDPYQITEIVKEFSNEQKKELSTNIQNEKKEIINKYIKCEFNKEEINKKNLQYKNNVEMNDFFQNIQKDYQLLEDKLKKNKNGLIEQHQFSEPDILPYYENSLLQVIEIIDLIFDKLINNIDSLPFSIKCICKIISTLINKKFPKEIKVKQNRFLINYFFQCLFFPILMNPTQNGFISEFIITDSISKNLQEIMKLLDKITFGVLFHEKHLFPLNIYVIEKMPLIFELFNKICQVELPNFIKNLLNDKLPNDYEYDYFKENPDESILYRNICFTIDELISLIENIQKFKDLTNFKKESLIPLLNKNIGKIKEIKKKYEKNDGNKEIIINMFLLSDMINNEKMKKIFESSNDNQNHFKLKELKKIENEHQEKQNTIIRAKNILCAFLYKYKTLLKNNYRTEKLSDIVNILKEIKNHSNLNSSIITDDNFNLKWYIDSLIRNLPKLSGNIIKNDYDQFLSELEIEIKKSIKSFNFEDLCIFIEHDNYLQKELIEYENINNIIIDIDLNRSAIDVIQNKKIIINIKSDNKHIIFFKELMENDEDFSNLFYKEKKNMFSNNITHFINAFPNLAKRQSKIEMDIFEYMKEKKVPEIIRNYISILKITLEKNEDNGNEKIIKKYKKIFDYIMEQLYDKLFPKPSFNDTDVKIYKNCFNHTWIKMSNIMPDNKINYMLDNYLPDSMKYFKLFETEKSPRKKLINIIKMFECIYKLKECTGEKIEGVDDELILLHYTFIKSTPQKITKDCKYTELFLGNKKLDKEGNHLTKIMAICKKMENFSFNDLFNISKLEYDNNIKRNIEKNLLSLKVI